jgi:hypothetical protein
MSPSEGNVHPALEDLTSIFPLCCVDYFFWIGIEYVNGPPVG